MLHSTDVVNNVKNQYGICTADNLSSSNSGLAYVSNSFDFDGDGINELYMIYLKPSTDIDSSIPTITQEIWKLKDNTPTKVFSDDSESEGLVNCRSIAISEDESNRAYLYYHFLYQTGAGEDVLDLVYDGNEYNTLQNDKLQEVANVTSEDKTTVDETEQIKYIYGADDNGKEISKDEYDATNSKYTKNGVVKILKDYGGSGSFEFDVSNNTQTINDFLTKLDPTREDSSLNTKIVGILQKAYGAQLEKAYGSQIQYECMGKEKAGFKIDGEPSEDYYIVCGINVQGEFYVNMVTGKAYLKDDELIYSLPDMTVVGQYGDN